MRALLRAPTRPVTRSFLFETGSDQPAPVLPPAGYLFAPPNLVPDAVASFDDLSGVNLNGNWAVPAETGALTCTNQSGSDDARIDLDEALTPGDFHFFLANKHLVTTGNIKIQLSGDGTSAAIAGTEPWQRYQPYPAASVTAYNAIRIKPNTAYDGSMDDIALYNLSPTDPSLVACDVLLIGGDSNVSNAAGEVTTPDNNETEFDGRIWYMPGLRIGGTYNDGKVTRHIPSPAIEPIVSMAAAKRMSLCHAAAAQLVEYSANRGRPLLIMALGEAGSGMTGSKGLWQKDAVPNNNAPRMWDEMTAMKAAVDNLGPDHEVIGMVWSIGANDRYAGTETGHENTRGPLYTQFFSDVSNDIADVPMVLVNIADHLDSSGSEQMRIFLRKLDKDSGHALSVGNMKVVEPPPGNPLLPDDLTDPHFNAAGAQANGRVAGQALLSMLPT